MRCGVLGRAAIVVGLCVSWASHASGQVCIPFEVQSQPDDLGACNTLSKTIYRTVIFPDANFSKYLQQTGGCEDIWTCVLGIGAWPTSTVECWPEFFAPVMVTNNWSRTARKRRAIPVIDTCFGFAFPEGQPYVSAATCTDAPVPNLAVANAFHVCSAPCPEECSEGFDEVDYCTYPSGCPSGYDDDGQGCCQASTPLIIDVSGNGFDLTRLEDGVLFDLNRDGIKEPLSWTSRNSDDAWLALDRNQNSVIDDGSELFGNYSPQPKEPGRNGFEALKQYDLLRNGGNADGRIGPEDEVYKRLLLWTDKNHNGVSEPAELVALTRTEPFTHIDLEYEETQRRDKHGNWFRYRSITVDRLNKRRGEVYDVYLLTGPLQQTRSLLSKRTSLSSQAPSQ